jgi:hypothetical protein
MRYLSFNSCFLLPHLFYTYVLSVLGSLDSHLTLLLTSICCLEQVQCPICSLLSGARSFSSTAALTSRAYSARGLCLLARIFRYESAHSVELLCGASSFSSTAALMSRACTSRAYCEDSIVLDMPLHEYVIETDTMECGQDLPGCQNGGYEVMPDDGVPPCAERR